MTIGLTGAGGVLGRRLRDALADRGAAVKPFKGDIRDTRQVTAWAMGCERIVHAAAIVPTDQVTEAPGTAIAVNVAGTANVAAAAAAIGARLTYISTSHIYAPSQDPLHEDATINPLSLYGLTKWQGEQWVERLSENPLVARIFSYFDGRQAPTYLLPALYDRVRAAPKGAELPLFGYSSTRDIADARWLAERLASMVLSDGSGIINFGTGRGYSIATIAGRVAQSIGREDISWTPFDDSPGDALVADISKLQSIARPPEFDLESALALFIEETSAA